MAIRSFLLAITIALATSEPLRVRPATRPFIVATQTLEPAAESSLPLEEDVEPEPAKPPPSPPPRFDVKKAARMAIGGGLSGWLAGIVQVVCLMWLRTAMNYQYRYGTSTLAALRPLCKQGGLGRV